MKKAVLFFGLWTAVIVATGVGWAGSFIRDRAGIGLRGSYWPMKNEEAMIQVSSHSLFHSRVDVGGGGGWINFFAGLGERGCLEFGFGAMGRIHTFEEGLFSNQVDVAGVMPILVGYQHFLFVGNGTDAFQPYVSVGGGPYILGCIHVHDRAWNKEEVVVKNKVHPGAYCAAGGYFLFSGWFAFQGEMRYHFIDFKPDNDTSGLELGLGMAFFWRK